MKSNWIVVPLIIIGFQRSLAQLPPESSTPFSTCNTWAIDITDDRTGKKTGEVFSMKDDYQSKLRAAEKTENSDKSLCKYFGQKDASCHSVLSKPYCTDHPKSAKKGINPSKSLQPPAQSTDKKNDMNVVIAALFSRMRPGQSGHCARAVANALAAAGSKFPGGAMPDAYQIGWFLEQAGFHALPAASYAPSAWQRGDIIVFQPIPGHKVGHVAVYDDQSQSWMSDFRQNNFNVDKNGGYNVGLYTIYRK